MKSCNGQYRKKQQIEITTDIEACRHDNEHIELIKALRGKCCWAKKQTEECIWSIKNEIEADADVYHVSKEATRVKKIVVE